MTTATLERPMTTGPAAKTLMDLAEEIAPIVRREADVIEAAGHLTPAVIDAIVERDLFQVLLMGARGIRDVTLTDACDFLRRVAMADGSTSWDLLAAMGGNLISGFLPEEAASRVYASRADAMATAVGSVGKAIAVEGGYLVEAKWPFLSGSSHATWLGGLCMVYDGDAPRMMPDGSPYLVVPLVRKERATVLDSWHSLGLRGTASHDAIVSGVFVPEAETADFARGPREELPLLFSIDENAAAPLAAASVALGIARGAVEAYRELQASRTHQSGVPAVEAPLPQLALAQAEAKLALAEAGVQAAARDFDAMLATGELPGEASVQRASLTATAAAESCVEAVSSLFRAAGSAAVFTGRSALERCLRDIYTIGAHRMLQRENYMLHARALFD